MVAFAVLGASGFTGRLVLGELVRQGHAVTAGVRDPDALGGELPDGVGATRFDVRDPDGPAGFLAAARPDVLLNTVGPFTELGPPVVEAAIVAGVPYVDCAGEQPHLRWLHERTAAVGAPDTPLVPGAGFEFLIGDLLGALAAGAVPAPREVHVAYTLPRTSDLLRGWSVGTRRSVVAALPAPGVALVDGALVEERPGAVRRVAWFPRPVGPHHVAAIPGGEALTLPRHVPGLTTVRTHLALPSLLAEALQATASLAGRPRAARLLERLATAPGDPSPARRAATRWACVAEAAGERTIARAWAYGTDLYRLTAAALVLVGERLAVGGHPGGLLAPAELGPAGDLLDELAARTDLRWSVARPARGG